MKKKTIALLLVLVMVFGISVGGTIAYLTDSKKVVNTFTVGDVAIKLTEAAVTAEGKQDVSKDRIEADPSASTPVGNQYHLIPNGDYYKDPTVTVVKDSEECFVRMKVTITKSATWDKVFEELNEGKEDSERIGAANVFTGLSDQWELKDISKNAADDSRTYEFWYKNKVAKANADTDLPALFTGIHIPGEINNDQLDSVKDTTITVVAHAIQAAGFDNAAAAWAAWN